MAPRSFLSLPYELRHMIYKYYFTTKEGYHSSPTSRKLTAARGEPIDLALMYTCHFVAEETKEMPFLYNDITFKTFYRQDLSAWLCRFDRLVEDWSGEAPRRSPRSSPPPDNRRYIDICPSDQAHSAHRAAIKFTLRLLCETSDEQFIASVNETLVDGEYSGGARLSNFLDRCYEPWHLPSSLSEFDEMERWLGKGKRWSSKNSWVTSLRHGLQYRPLYRFSAASAAIGFLNALSVNKRSSLRNIIIHEDRISAGYPDGHAIGLIPFCQENGRLRIRHKFSMVRNLFERAYFSDSQVDDIEKPDDEVTAAVMFRLAGMNLYTIVGNCLAEAMYLPDAGMPDGSYTLLLDGEDAGDLCSAFFQQEVLGKEARRLVLSRALKEEPNSVWAHEAYGLNLPLNAHSGALEHLVNKTSFFESNFDPGHFDNVDTLMAHYKQVGTERCIDELMFWGMEYDYEFKLFSDVPRWGRMLMENFEWRKRPAYRPITHRRIDARGAM
ncbi:hypothetical protein FMUND_5539 [Fusarium mundagurra]|uniref:Uncharacterized protein n=1 Tax=Fusarium mundagurra TaxID=1567541 RepID=A0A8H6DH85_9HYPO|nr:hypothetical protein FMUND_5539 [Fusarium mundagurra]